MYWVFLDLNLLCDFERVSDFNICFRNNKRKVVNSAFSEKKINYQVNVKSKINTVLSSEID